MRYLLYSSSDDISQPRWDRDSAGVMHWNRQLGVLCREAVWLGRTPVFSRIAPLSERHNFNVEIRRPFSDYLDTGHIEVLYRPDGDARPLQTLSLAAIDEVKLQSLNIPPDEILKLPAGTPVSAEQNRRFRLVWRSLTPHRMWRYQRAPLRTEACALEPASVDCAPLEKEEEILRVDFRASAQVRKLAAEVIRQLPRGYCAIHVRRGDLLNIPALKVWTSPEAVAQSLERAGLAPGVPLYLMSDELSRRWLHQVRRKRLFLHFTDFPRLARLIRPPKPDNYFLFLVEQEIFEHAEMKFALRTKTVDQRDHAFLLPKSMYPAQLRALYHPAEIELSRARVFVRQNLRSFLDPLSKARRLASDGSRTLKAPARYWMLRLFTPKTLKRHRDRRKALGVPG